MANEVLGHGQCPVCKSEYSQEIRLSSSGKPYMNCDECGCQIFARQPLSVKIMRGLVSPAASPSSVDDEQKKIAKNDGAGSSAASSTAKSGEAAAERPQHVAPVRHVTTLMG